MVMVEWCTVMRVKIVMKLNIIDSKGCIDCKDCNNHGIGHSDGDE